MDIERDHCCGEGTTDTYWLDGNVTGFYCRTVNTIRSVTSLFIDFPSGEKCIFYLLIILIIFNFIKESNNVKDVSIRTIKQWLRATCSPMLQVFVGVVPTRCPGCCLASIYWSFCSIVSNKPHCSLKWFWIAERFWIIGVVNPEDVWTNWIIRGQSSSLSAVIDRWSQRIDQIINRGHMSQT